jgi:aspartyl-tRNA(Asn)/glutamyl-tRNA(Gln) amidotransferase subunit A
VHHRDAYTSVTRNALEFGLGVPAPRYLAALDYRAVTAAAVRQRLFEAVDAVLTPTVPVTAPSLVAVLALLARSDSLPLALGRNTKPANFLGLPALSVPCGFSAAGLPVGLQLMGAPFSEGLLLTLGHAFQAATSFHECQPPAVARTIEQQAGQMSAPAISQKEGTT